MSIRDRFVTLMARTSEDISLDEAALLVAAEEYPDLDIGTYLARLDAMVASLQPSILRELDPTRLVQLLNDHLFVTLGLRGNTAEYDDPRNSYLNEVIDRRVGIPITLSIIYITVGRRLNLPMAGVSFPGHFLVTYLASSAPLFVDPFNQGRLMHDSDLRRAILEQFGSEVDFDPAVLRPATAQEIIARLLRNLKHIYVTREDFPRAILCSERILIATELPEERRDLGTLLSKEGRVREAIPLLERYLADSPGAADRPNIEALLERLRGLLRRLN